MRTYLTTALEFHQAGRYADAARCYHGLLTREPNNADALHLFGVMHHQCGHSGRAVDLIGRAAALRPGAAQFHSNLAEAYRGLGEHEHAVDCCRTALQLQPCYPEALNNLGMALEALGRHEEAAEQFRAAIRARPEFALAWNNLGTTLRKLDCADEARDAFRQAVELDATSAMAQANLGQALVDAGEAKQGLEFCIEATRLQPDLAAAHNNLGNAYRALDRWPEAHAAYARALAISPELAPAKIHANLGLALQRENKIAESFACLRRAVDLAPDDAEMWQYLANAHIADEDPAAAIPCCERIVALEPGQAQSHCDLGWVLQEDGRLAEAAACYQRAVELEPETIFPHMKQGALHEELGEMAQAEACFRRANAINDQAPPPLACLATLLRGRLPNPDREAIRARLGDSKLDDGSRVSLLFGLSHVCDAQGDHAEAALCLEQANMLALQQRTKQNRIYDAHEHGQFIDRLIAAFSPELLARLAEAGDTTRRPVFVVGIPRSGTTLVEQILASHSRVHGAGELRLVRQAFDAIPSVVGRDGGTLQCLTSLDAPAVQELARRHAAALDLVSERAKLRFVPDRIVDKMPDNYLYLGLISLLFPRATLVHVRRDPRDVGLSCWLTNFRSIRWANDQNDIAQRIRCQKRIMSHWHSALPKPIHEVVYERLVDDFEAEARRLVTVCGLDWEPACLDFHQTVRPVRTASVTQVRQPLYRRSLARWRNYEDHLAELFDRLPTE